MIGRVAPWFAWVLWCSYGVTSVFRRRPAHLKSIAGMHPGGGAVDQAGTTSLPHVNYNYCHQAGHGNSHSLDSWCSFLLLVV